MLKRVKRIISAVIPNFIMQKYWHYIRFRAMKKVSTRETFEKIYSEQMWGISDDPIEKFYSGAGSHRSTVVSLYVNAIQNFIKEFDHKFDVVDLGCGDFAVGSQLRKYFKSYIACDVVEPLIERNEQIYKYLNVDFKVLDIIKDELPCGEIVFIRQVFQHLSNIQIKKILPKLIKNYKYLILTEHIPASHKFKANMDKPEGPDIRLGFEINPSGIVLTKPPFNLKALRETILCETFDDGGIIRTVAYTLN